MYREGQVYMPPIYILCIYVISYGAHWIEYTYCERDGMVPDHTIQFLYPYHLNEHAAQ